jgi:hypothetical protein
MALGGGKPNHALPLHIALPAYTLPWPRLVVREWAKDAKGNIAFEPIHDPYSESRYGIIYFGDCIPGGIAGNERVRADSERETADQERPTDRASEQAEGDEEGAESRGGWEEGGTNGGKEDLHNPAVLHEEGHGRRLDPVQVRPRFL